MFDQSTAITNEANAADDHTPAWQRLHNQHPARSIGYAHDARPDPHRNRIERTAAHPRTRHEEVARAPRAARRPGGDRRDDDEVHHGHGDHAGRREPRDRRLQQERHRWRDHAPRSRDAFTCA